MNLGEIRESGLLELYIFGTLEDAELALVNEALANYPELENDLDEIEQSLLLVSAVEPPMAMKSFLVATIDYTERLKNGEQFISPPTLNENSSLADFSLWLNNPSMDAPEDFGVVYTKIISAEAEKSTAIVWLRYGAPDETHTDEFEKFLVVEGTCDITIGEKVHSLKAGDYLEIPLFINHNVRVTSEMPCKIILQRVAA